VYINWPSYPKSGCYAGAEIRPKESVIARIQTSYRRLNNLVAAHLITLKLYCSFENVLFVHGPRCCIKLSAKMLSKHFTLSHISLLRKPVMKYVWKSSPGEKELFSLHYTRCQFPPHYKTKKMKINVILSFLQL
jgi:hypothetical protein